MQFLFSGYRTDTGNKERVDILGTPAQLRSLGQALTDINANTGFKGKNGVLPSYPINLPVMRVLLSDDPPAPLQIDVVPQGLSLTAGKATFGIIGTSVVNSFAEGTADNYEVLVKAMADSTVLTDPHRDLYFRSLSPSSAPPSSEEFYGIGI